MNASIGQRITNIGMIRKGAAVGQATAIFEKRNTGTRRKRRKKQEVTAT